MTGKEVNKFILTTPVNQTITNPEDKDIRSEYLLKVIDEVFSDERVKVKTDINMRQILALTKGELFANRYSCNIMKDLCIEIMTLSISKDRRSRKEFTEISKNITEPTEEEKPITIRKRLFNE